jgi:hypothetical protein
MLLNGYGNPETGVVSADDCERFAARLPEPIRKTRKDHKQTNGESIRLVAHGYRRPSWDLAFEIEVVTLGGVCAHDLRDDRWYSKGAA